MAYPGGVPMGNSGFETALGFFGEFSFVGLFERLSESFARIRDLSRQRKFCHVRSPSRESN